MIFVTIGTSKPFDRLLEALDGIELEGGEELVVQCGDSALRPSDARCVGFLPFAELVEQMRGARILVAHAGAGTVLTAVSLGVRPLVVPRLSAHGEAADDHQVDFARRLAQAGLVSLVEDPTDLPAAIATAPDARLEAAVSQRGSELAVELRDYLRATVYGVPGRGHAPRTERVEV
jgi:UDP-N-acetylglucosamine transferase subunit ALG13